jgi:hypothetical protein
MATNKNIEEFSVKKIKNNKTIWTNMYSDPVAEKHRWDRTPEVGSDLPTTAEEVRELIDNALTSSSSIIKASRRLYAVNPIYAKIIDYLSNMYMWRYKVTPHRSYTKSKAKNRKTISSEDFKQDYQLMLEAIDGLNVETTFPNLLTHLFVNGAIYFTTVYNEDQILIDTLVLPVDRCRKIGETQYGTNIIQFDMQYFDSLGLTEQQRKEFLGTFPKEIQSAYNKYKKDSNLRWTMLDPTYSSCLMMNEYGVPTFFYLYASILNYEKYQDNELERNENLLKYIVVQTMPIYQDKLVFEMDEVAALHRSMKKVIDKGDKARLLTTYGSVNVQRIAEDESTQSDVLAKALEAIYDNGGFNPTLFTGDSVEALKMALVRDQSFVWHYVQQLCSFYNIAVNNYLTLKNYEVDFEILRLSCYTYSDDIEIFKNNATLGVGKIDYLVASGIKQKNIQDTLELENYLHLDQITPMQTSYTQSSADIDGNTASNEEDEDNTSKSSDIEPSKDSDKTSISSKGSDVKDTDIR